MQKLCLQRVKVKDDTVEKGQRLHRFLFTNSYLPYDAHVDFLFEFYDCAEDLGYINITLIHKEKDSKKNVTPAIAERVKVKREKNSMNEMVFVFWLELPKAYEQIFMKSEKELGISSLRDMQQIFLTEADIFILLYYVMKEHKELVSLWHSYFLVHCTASILLGREEKNDEVEEIGAMFLNDDEQCLYLVTKKEETRKATAVIRRETERSGRVNMHEIHSIEKSLDEASDIVNAVMLDAKSLQEFPNDFVSIWLDYIDFYK